MSVPALRFKEFSVDWEEKALGEISDVTKLAGYEFTKHIVYRDTGDIIALRGLNVKENKLDLTSVKYIDESDFSKLSRSKLIINDLLFTYVGTIGDVALIKENDKFYLAPNVSRIRVNSNILMPSFALHYFNNSDFKEKQINLYIATSSQPALSMENIRKFKIELPALKEQTKIANFLTAVDERVTLLTQKASLLSQYKKGVMQQIFSQELRFKDDDEQEFPEWEESELGKVSTIIMGQSPDSKSYNDINEGQPLIQGNADISNRKTNPRIWTSQPTKECKINDIILTVRAPVGAVAKSYHNACIGRGVCAIRNSDKSTTDFIYHLLLWFEPTKWVSLEQGSTFTAVNSNDIKTLTIPVPCLKEQTKIANFLTAIDDKITNNQTQLDAVKQYKQGLLQQMFV